MFSLNSLNSVTKISEVHDVISPHFQKHFANVVSRGLPKIKSHALPIELSRQVLTEGSSTQLLFVHQLTFGLGGTERI